jgi:translation initiation factor 4E
MTSNTKPDLKLNNKWTFWYHNPKDTEWGINSYIKLGNITNVSEFWQLMNSLDNNIVENSMLFIMKDNIIPMWEDKNNCKGGSWSFKIYKNTIKQVWEDVCINIICDNITKNKSDTNTINGISISPKKSFCILKIWNDNKNINNYKLLNNNIKNINLNESIYKPHI